MLPFHRCHSSFFTIVSLILRVAHFGDYLYYFTFTILSKNLVQCTASNSNQIGSAMLLRRCGHRKKLVVVEVSFTALSLLLS